MCAHSLGLNRGHPSLNTGCVCLCLSMAPRPGGPSVSQEAYKQP